MSYTVVSSISQTYLKTLNNSTTFALKIKIDLQRHAEDEIDSMHVVSMTEQVVRCIDKQS